MTHLYKVALFVLISSAVCAQDMETVLVPVSHSTTKAKRVKKSTGLIQLRPGSDSLEIWAFGFKTLPGLKFSFRNPNQKIRKQEVNLFARRSLDSTYRVYSDTSLGIWKSPRLSAGMFNQQKEKFLSGHRAPAYFTYQWIRLGSSAPSGSDRFVQTKKVFRRPVTISTRLLPGTDVARLPAIDPWNCSPADVDYFRLRKQTGYSVRGFVHKPYRATGRVYTQKRFEIHFQRNESTPNPGDITIVTDFLTQNDFVILRAELEGASSVEGPPERNRQLQASRAQVLSSALRRFNNDPQRIDTIRFSDNWSVFRQQLLRTKYSSLDSLSNEELNAVLMKDEAMRNDLEPLLSAQRKASLNLVMAKVLSKDEQFIKVGEDLSLLTGKLYAREWESTMPKVMGILRYLLDQNVQGNVSYTQVDNIIGEAQEPLVRVLMGYEVIQRFESLSSKEFHKLWPEYYQDFFRRACSEVIDLAAQAADPHRKQIYVKMCADFQAYTQQFVLSGLLDEFHLGTDSYPERPEFMGLKLHHHAWIYAMQRAGKLNGGGHTASVRRNQDVPARPIESLVDEIQRESQLSVMFQENKVRLRRLNYNTEEKGAYYFLLKTYFVKGDKSVTKWVDFSNGTGLNAFSLFDLLSMTLGDWVPEKNHFYDREVQIVEIDKLVARLKKMPGIICTPQVNELFLNYHLKALHYLTQYAEPGNVAHVRIAETSLGFVSDYYKSRARDVVQDLSMLVCSRLNSFNWLPCSRQGAWYGFQVMKQVAKARVLTDRELKLYAQYLRIFDPQLREPLPVIYKREVIEELWANKY